MRRRLLALSALLAGSAVATVGHAQSNTALDRYEPSPAGDVWLAVPSATAEGELGHAARLQLGYAHAPLSLLVERDGEEVGTVGDIVDHSLVLHVLTSVAIARRIKLELDLPAVLSQGGDSPQSGSPDTYASPDGASLGDLRLGARIALLRQEGWAPAAAAGFSVWLPSGDDDAYTSTGAIRFAPSLTVGADHDFASYALSVGRRFQGGRSAPGSLLASEAFIGVAGGPRFGPLLVGVEVFGSTVADEGVGAFEERTTNAEALLSARYDWKPVAFHAAGGPGLSSGIGTPSFRVTAGISIAGDLGELLLEGDGRDDPSGELGGAKGTHHRRAAAGRGPVAAVGAPGSASAPVADREGDGIADVDDPCSTDPACRATARITADSIVIVDKIRFATGSAELDPVSEPTLAEIANIMKRHPEIARLGVDGHTDNVGPEDENIALSEQRALTVVRWLTAHGVDARRTEARGFGPKRPMADNETEEGRAKNRRVEFQILRRTDAGETGWSDGSLD